MQWSVHERCVRSEVAVDLRATGRESDSQNSVILSEARLVLAQSKDL